MNDEIIKALEWEAGEYPDEMTAGNYNIWHEGHGFQVYHWSIVCGEPHPTFAAAQVAAEADYRARIAAALDLTAVERLVEAAEAYKRERLKLDDTPEFCAMVAALAAFNGATK